jgi:hypothetical protein
MKKVTTKLLSLLFVLTLLAGCNSDLEKRVSSLERRVVEIENKGQVQGNVQPNLNQPVSQTPVQNETKPDGPLPEFSFTKTDHDFGQITEGDVVTHTFTFTNSGEAPLIIQDAKATCGCTVPSYPKTPIPAGGTGEIVVKFDSSNKPGVQNKTVTLTANTYPSTNKLNIKSVVVAKN